jgi:NAD dependent epimerase/dehydratase family enzyme
MRVAAIGATGFIGIPLCKELLRAGFEVTVFARSVDSVRQKLGSGYDIVEWDAASEIPLQYLSDVDAVINLAGESIGDGRWSKERKERILNSRVSTTKRIVEALERLDKLSGNKKSGRKAENKKRDDSASTGDSHSSNEMNELSEADSDVIGKVVGKPEVLINASAIGYYGPRKDEKLCEDGSSGDDFLASVCVAWENEAMKAERLGVRVVRVRTGVVLGESGALKRMLTPFKLFAGGPVGSGSQWLSWIHKDDEIGIIIHALQNQNISGAINATAPEPATMKQFSKILGSVLKRPSWLPVPGFVLKLGLGEMSCLVLTGQRVLPCKALGTGYTFKFKSLNAALQDILKR